MYNCCFALVFWRAVLSVGLQCGRVVASMCLFTILERIMTIAVSGAFAESLSPSWVDWIDSHAWWVRSGCFALVRCFVVVSIELDGLVRIINLSVYSFLCWLAMLPRVTGLIRAHDRCARVALLLCRSSWMAWFASLIYRFIPSYAGLRCCPG